MLPNPLAGFKGSFLGRGIGAGDGRRKGGRGRKGEKVKKGKEGRGEKEREEEGETRHTNASLLPVPLIVGSPEKLLKWQIYGRFCAQPV